MLVPKEHTVMTGSLKKTDAQTDDSGGFVNLVHKLLVIQRNGLYPYTPNIVHGKLS